MQVGKSEYIELDETWCCTEKFNMALSLYGVLGIALYFSESFLEAVDKVLWPLRVTVICFLR